MTKTHNVTRWIVAAVVAAFLVGATVAGAIVFFYGTTQEATLLSLFQKFLQPLGTALGVALYLWRDFLNETPKSESKAKSDSHATAQAAATPQTNILNYIQLPQTPLALQFDKEELADMIDSLIRDKSEFHIKAVIAEHLIITDRNGKPRIFLGTDAMTEPVLSTLDESGKLRAVLTHIKSQEREEPQFTLWDNEARIRFCVELNTGTPILNVIGPDKKSQCILCATTGGPIVALCDKTEALRASLNCYNLGIYDEKENLIAQIPAASE